MFNKLFFLQKLIQKTDINLNKVYKFKLNYYSKILKYNKDTHLSDELSEKADVIFSANNQLFHQTFSSFVWKLVVEPVSVFFEVRSILIIVIIFCLELELMLGIKLIKHKNEA